MGKLEGQAAAGPVAIRLEEGEMQPEPPRKAASYIQLPLITKLNLQFNLNCSSSSLSYIA